MPITGILDERSRAKLFIKNLPSQVSFIEAVKKNDIIAVKSLIAAGAHVNAKDKHGETPLHVAAVRGYQKIASMLIIESADVNAIDGRGLTPLHAAALNGQKEAVELLIDKGADLSAKNENGVTPLQMASQNGHQSIVELLQKSKHK